jgi:hypothetical protein
LSCQAAETIANKSVLNRYTHPHLTFDHEPRDDELVWLLGNHRLCYSNLTIDDTGAELVGRSKRVSLKVHAPAMLFCGVIFTGLISFVPERQSAAYMTIFVWITVAATIAGWIVLNRKLVAEGDYFRADKQARWLDLCPIGRRFVTEEILGFSELTRHDRPGTTGETWIRQYGVLVRDGDGRIDHYPIAVENHALLSKPMIAVRLAALFAVPVRRVKLSRRQSRELHDW